MKINIPRHTSPDSCFESLWLECTTRLGRGTSRDVYEIPGHNKVLKVTTIQTNFSNWCEIVIHSQKKETGKLAEITSWSLSGRFIVMEKLTPLKQGDDLGNFVYPDYLTDRKLENCGYNSDGEIKVLDYASLALFDNTMSCFN